VTPSPPKLLPSLLGGLFIGVLSALPLISLANCCCLWVITGGFLAAWLQQQNHDQPITAVDGAIVGLLAGFVGGIVHYLVVLPLEMFLGDAIAGMSDGFMRGQQEMPEVRRLMNELGPHGVLLLGSMAFGALSMVFGMIGGILGAVMIKKPPGPPVPPVPPPPPEPRWGPPTSPYAAFPSAGDAGGTRPQWPPPPPPRDEKPPE
jgi:hypothetical protein